VHRETFATSGTRIAPRMFGGWNLAPELCTRADMLEVAYGVGVPMGGELSRDPVEEGAPSFLVAATADPSDNAAPLQRIQIVKGWLTEDGQAHYRVFEVDGNPNNGATVDENTCERRGDGFSMLCGVWRDPEFSANERAFYYARVIENPSCRWSTY